MSATTPSTSEAPASRRSDTYIWKPGTRRRELTELWASKELLYFFVWKEFTVRYKQTVIGVLWVVLQPLAFALMFAGIILHKSSADFALTKGSSFVPLYLGMCYWLMVSSAVMNGSNALLSSYALLNKVYVPRQIPVLAATLLAGTDFIFAVSLVPFFALATGTPLNPGGFAISVLCAIPLLAATHGFVLILSAAVVRFRDLRIVVPYIVNLLFFFSSALFPLALYASTWRKWVLSNPVAAVIEWARHMTFGLPSQLTSETTGRAIAFSVGATLVGLVMFTRMTRNLVEQL